MKSIQLYVTDVTELQCKQMQQQEIQQSWQTSAVAMHLPVAHLVPSSNTDILEDYFSIDIKWTTFESGEYSSTWRSLFREPQWKPHKTCITRN